MAKYVAFMADFDANDKCFRHEGQTFLIIKLSCLILHSEIDKSNY